MNDLQQVMKEARETIEFHGPWWDSAVEGEPLCQDEIDEVKDMVKLLSTLLSGLEEAQREIRELKTELSETQMMCHNFQRMANGYFAELQELRYPSSYKEESK